MPTYRFIIEYDGTDWHGWQSQPDCVTVQDAIEEALKTVLRTSVAVVGSGRTDSGVHARGQVAHMRTDKPIDVERLQNSLNGILPGSVVIKALDAVDDGFHARYDARLRSYAYYVTVRPSALFRRYQWHIRRTPDFSRMNEAARALIGRHDFSAFCKTASGTINRECHVTQADWLPGSPWPIGSSVDRDESSGSWVFFIKADRFLHGMVRTIVGTLVEVGHGKRSPESFVGLLNSLDRQQAGFAAPAHGLVLEHVEYLRGEDLRDQGPEETG